MNHQTTTTIIIVIISIAISISIITIATIIIISAISIITTTISTIIIAIIIAIIIVAIVAITTTITPGDVVEVVLDQTPFYAESGGQVGDQGVLRGASGAALAVSDVRKAAGGRLFVHTAEVQEGSVSVGQQVRGSSWDCMHRGTLRWLSPTPPPPSTHTRCLR